MPPVHLMFASQWRFEGGKLEAKIEGWGLSRRQLFHATQLLFQLQSDGHLQLRLFPHHDGGHCAGICGSGCRTQYGSCKRLASYVCDHMPVLRCPSSIAMILSKFEGWSMDEKLPPGAYVRGISFVVQIQ